MKLLIVIGCTALGAYVMGPLGALIWCVLGLGLALWLSSRTSPDDKISAMRRSLGYDTEDDESTDSHDKLEAISVLTGLDQLAHALKAPPEIFALNIPLEETLRSWTPEEIAVLNHKVSNYIRGNRLPEFDAALEKFKKRLEPILPKPTDGFDPEASKEALLKMYSDK